MPCLVKDNIFTLDGCFASAGAGTLATFLPPFEASLITRLRDAGAVLLGKTNLTEFADFVSEIMPAEFSGAGGVVHNPLGLQYGRGRGASVGSAAVAAGFCAFAIGSETQNSLQEPAVHSSIASFKPTVGRVSRYGLIPRVPSQDLPGPLTRTIEDAQQVYQAIAGADMQDTATLADFAEASGGASLQGLRIGVPRRFIADSVLTESRRAVFERLLETLAPCGIASLNDLIQWNRAHPDTIPYGQALLEAAETAPDIRSEQYRRDRRADIALSLDAGILAALRIGHADVLLSPMTAAKCTGKAGAPVAAIPAGQDAEGLPFGVTLYSAPGHDLLVLQAAAAVERVIGQRIVPTLGDS